MLARLALSAAAAWLGYAWAAHLATPLCVHRGPGAGLRVALTFDDGPDPEWTPRVLDVLARAGCPPGLLVDPAGRAASGAR
jgi:peptidoglycan/xylan/chitin deacetylase (PgdA/CDA1 family)